MKVLLLISDLLAFGYIISFPCYSVLLLVIGWVTVWPIIVSLQNYTVNSDLLTDIQ